MRHVPGYMIATWWEASGEEVTAVFRIVKLCRYCSRYWIVTFSLAFPVSVATVAGDSCLTGDDKATKLVSEGHSIRQSSVELWVLILD